MPNDAEIAVVEASRRRRRAETPAPAAAERQRRPLHPRPSAPARRPLHRAPAAAAPAPAAPAPASPPRPRARQRRPAATAAPRPPLPSTSRRRPSAAFEGRMTPAVRRLAREHGVDLARVAGTGIGGRVTRDDVAGVVAAGGNGSAAAAGPRRAPAPAAAPAPARPQRRRRPRHRAVAAGDSLKKLSPMRKAHRGADDALADVPAAYMTVEVDMTAVVRRRDTAKRDYQAREGIALSSSPS